MSKLGYASGVSSGNPWGLGGLIFNPTPTVFSTPATTPTYNPIFTTPIGSNNSGGIVPNVTATGAGMQVQSTTLDKILGSILSGMAIVKGATAVPTTISGQQSYSVDPYQQAAYLQAMQGQDGTAAGKVENWVKQNTGVVLIGGAIVVALMMKPPTRR